MDKINPSDLPDIDPDAPLVSLASLECRVCGQHSAWSRTDQRDCASWVAAHCVTTGHGDYYVWTLTRNHALLVSM